MALISLSQLLDRIDKETIASAKEMITVTTTEAKILTSAVYGTHKRALIQVQDSNIKYWQTGATPTDTDGIFAEIGKFIVLTSNEDISNFKVIAILSDAKLACQYSD
jgi:hypothetical protein